jgi:hypothetical protein
LIVGIGALGLRYRLGAQEVSDGQAALAANRWDDALSDAAAARTSLPWVFDAPSNGIETTASRERDAAGRLGQAKAALDAEKWDEARASLSAIPADTTSSAEAELVRSQVDSAESDAKMTQRLLSDAQAAWRSRQWDEAQRLLREIPASRPVEQQQAQVLSDQIAASQSTAEIVVAARNVATIEDTIEAAVSKLQVGVASAQDIATIRAEARDLSVATARLGVALHSGTDGDLMPVHLLRDKGAAPVDALERAATTNFAEATDGTQLTARDGGALHQALTGFRSWSRYFFFSAANGPAGFPPIDPKIDVADLIPYAANPDEGAQLFLGWIVASRATSKTAGEAVLRYFLDDTLANTARHALTQRLADVTAATIFTVAPLTAYTAADDASAGAGDLAPGTVVDDLGTSIGINATGTAFVGYQRLRIRSDGKIVYIPGDQNGFPFLVESDHNDLIASVAPDAANQIQNYLTSNHLRLFGVLYGQMTADGTKRLLLTGVDEGCGSCHVGWIAVWDIASGRPLWKSTGQGAIALLPTGDGFDEAEAIDLPGAPLCCPTRERVRSMTWNGTTFVPGTAHDLDLPHPQNATGSG